MTINDVMIEADNIEASNDGKMSPQTYLARLNHDQRLGRSVNADTVAELRKTLRIRPMKQIDRIMLSDPFGVYYTRITIPFTEFYKDTTRQHWDANPIETVELWMIPPGVKATAVATTRLQQAGVLKLHFTRGILSNVAQFTFGLPLNCTELHLQNVKMYLLNTTDLFSKIKLSCPMLKTIRYNDRVIGSYN